jgi:hypothetical protein
MSVSPVTAVWREVFFMSIAIGMGAEECSFGARRGV